MNPPDELRSLYNRFSRHRDFGSDLETFLALHYVFATPDYIVLAKPVIKGSPEADIIEPTFLFCLEQCDTWFIFACACSKKDFVAFIPFDLTWIAWQRSGARLRYWTLEHFRKHAKIRSFT